MHTAGFDVDFPVIAKESTVATAMGYVGSSFLADCVSITRWYNRSTKVIAGSVIFSGGCEGPPGISTIVYPQCANGLSYSSLAPH